MRNFHPSNRIHPTAVIEGDVRLGERNEILPYAVLIGPLEVGDDNWIGPHAVIGTPGEDTRNPRHDASQRKIVIGSRNIIREHVAVQKPCYEELTRIGNDVFLMHGVHVPHDADVADRAVAAPLAVIGGIAKILEGANLGMGCTVHQYGIVGPYSIVATGAAAVKNVRPFTRFIPGKPVSVNEYAIEKFGFQDCAGEIRDYVLKGVAPRTERLRLLIARYEELHARSRREQY